MSTVLQFEPSHNSTVRFISDLHLGNKRSTAPSPQKLLDSVRGVDMLVLVGDTAETRETCTERERSMELREELRELCRRSGLQLVELAGNHDPDIEPQLAFFWGGRVAAMHGHCLLPGVSPWGREYFTCAPTIRRLISEHPRAEHDLQERLELTRRISIELGRHVPPPSPNDRGFFRELCYCFWPPHRPFHIVSAWLTCCFRARRFCKSYLPNTELLIIGHFHRGLHRKKSPEIICTGAWFKHATPYAVDVQTSCHPNNHTLSVNVLKMS